MADKKAKTARKTSSKAKTTTGKKTSKTKKTVAKKVIAKKTTTRKTGAQKPSTRVDAIKHKDKRANIPTKELRGFVAEDELKPKNMLYPRDPSLDPQLVWKGKDEQDSEDLAVPVVPIYIQEKIHPQAIIENVRTQAKKDIPDHAIDFFGDFNNIKFEDMVDFYKHEANWSNRMILGDSLLVMASLAEKENLKGKVQMIYIDPPYGIKFGSNWQVSTRNREVKDRKQDVTREPEQVRAFRDTWELGIHSYLAYLRDRFMASRDLLTETGSIFIQIGDENVHLVRCLLDEVFGSGNFCSLITIIKTSSQTSELLPGISDYIIWYSRDRNQTKYRKPVQEKTEEDLWMFDRVELEDGLIVAEDNAKAQIALSRGNGKLIHFEDLTSQTGNVTTRVQYDYDGGRFKPPGSRGWRTNQKGLRKLEYAKRLIVSGNRLSYRRYADDLPVKEMGNLWDDLPTGYGSDERLYVVQTNSEIVKRCLLMSTDPGDLVLDPTCGSGTTAYVAEQWGRRWITVDTSRVALALARTRLMAAKYPYYHLVDSPEGIKKEAEITGKTPPDHKTDNDIRKGFVYKRVPHVTLKSIANNYEIIEGMTREEIDKAIARHADVEYLYDQPYQDNKRIRVSGPFTAESLSPYRVLSPEVERPATEVTGEQESTAGQFATLVIENLKKSGVQNTQKKERLKFDFLEPHSGLYVHATGEYTDKGGKAKRVAVSVGPEYGAVGPDQVKEAAKEAVQGLGHDLLIVCGYAFDPHVSEEASRYGKLAVLPTRINAELWMKDDLLKKTGAGNLFMVFGEPDISIKTGKDGKITVEIHGVDIYDPTTGEIRSSATDDIACWFIDTNYNGESFFVRHAYFTGGKEPYDKLKRALRAEIDEVAWSQLYSAKSQPFEKPETGKFAVKVINHYGDEVLKVYEV